MFREQHEFRVREAIQSANALFGDRTGCHRAGVGDSFFARSLLPPRQLAAATGFRP